MQITKSIAIAACAVALSAPAAVIAEKRDGAEAEAPTILSKGEIRLAKLLDGREAGEPVSCIRFRPNDRLQVIDDTAIVYGRGKTIYVNYTKRPERIDDRDVMVSRRFGSHVCKTDIVTKIDNLTGVYSGNVFLSEFIPYTRVKKDS